MEKLALVGLPNVGKSSLFNALTGAETPVAKHPFSTTETVTGAAIVPDGRLSALAEMSRSKKTVFTHIEVVDIGGVTMGTSSGDAFSKGILAGIREADVLLYVLRGFEDPEVVGETDAMSALEILELELVMADSAAAETLLERRRKAARADKSLLSEVEALEAARDVLNEGMPIYRSGISDEMRNSLKGFFLLTDKKVLAVINVGEDQLGEESVLQDQISEKIGGSPVLSVCVQLEAEAFRLPEEERAEMLEGLGLGEGALARVARSSFESLGRATFFTTGDKESRAWTFRSGAKAPECAGAIHSDLQRGFIRAEVIHWDDLLSIGSWSQAKTQGKIRLEGKEYVVLDGDVVEIRFNV